ncbi:molecular chaperone GrpE [Catenuloplanes atrovinosus]|uniref:Molecular chaperone GrpE (Heat shock protein) n=1 Tax=Catenuloplanes atrovinosus TaxID=137266 RepID=A0AAE3YT06_9ACTN|nr:molecular chaperone GrpE [Catenuloplanes atrovinosus]MDR7279110.1 molecular chaperone GrpE (heat shock protein) [Catenuloplanes atrovinosus]
MDGHPEDKPAPDTDADPLSEVATRLGRVEEQLADFHRRSAHREGVIDRLHEENQRFREGLRRVILEPIVTDLLRLYDSMTREAGRLAGTDAGVARMLEGYADETEMTIERCGYQLFRAVPGEPFQAGRHGPAGTVPTTDPVCDNTVAEALAAGVLETETGRVRRPARARFHRYDAGPTGQQRADHQSHVGSE